jgi:oligoribonuclease
MDKKLANIRPERILWVDLEMTGLSVEKDLILEVAAIVTDWDFNEVNTYHGVIKNNVNSLKKRINVNSTFWDKNPESRDGLLAQNSDGRPLKKIEAELLQFIEDNFTKNVPVLLAGNSVHMDRRFIVANWPHLDAKLHYRMLDVSAWKIVFDGKFGYKFLKPDAHRALDDIRGSILELKYYLAKLK